MITGSRVMTIFLLDWSDWPEIWESEIPLSEFCTISEDLGKLVIPNLAWISLMKCFWMLLNARITAFTNSELLRETQQKSKITPLPPPPQPALQLKSKSIISNLFMIITIQRARIKRSLYAKLKCKLSTIKSNWKDWKGYIIQTPVYS